MNDKVLCWDKPNKKLTTAEWKDSYGFEDGPTGGYVPNMSDDDAKKWKAKLVGSKTGYPQVEIRRTMRGGQLLLIVNLGAGYKYKHYVPGSHPPIDRSQFYALGDSDAEIDQMLSMHTQYTEGMNVHLAANGGLQLTFAEMTEMYQAVEEARQYLLTRSNPV